MVYHYLNREKKRNEQILKK